MMPGPRASRPKVFPGQGGWESEGQALGSGHRAWALALLRGSRPVFNGLTPADRIGGAKGEGRGSRSEVGDTQGETCTLRAVGVSPGRVPTGSQRGGQLNWRRWSGGPSRQKEPGKEGCGRGAVASPAPPPPSFTQARPAVPARRRVLGGYTPPHRAVFPAEACTPARGGAPKTGERRERGRKLGRSGKRECTAGRPGPA